MPRHSSPCGALSLTVLLLALGCSREPAQELPSAPPNFELESAQGINHEGAPAIALGFTRALDPAQDFDLCVRIEHAQHGPIAIGPIFDRMRQRLILPYLERGAEYRVSVCPGLRAVDGSELGKALAQTVTAGGTVSEGLVRFGSSGTVLPAHGHRGLPVQSIGIRQVDVDFFRVLPQELPALLAEPPRARNLGGWELSEMAPALELAYSGRFEIAAGESQSANSLLPIQRISELRRPGVYVAAMRPAGSFAADRATTLFFVTDLAIHTRLYSEGLLVLAASLESGEPLADAEVAVLDELGRVVLSGRTEADGALFLPGRPRSGQVVYARRGAHHAWISLTQTVLKLSEFEVGGILPSPWSLALWSGRDLYRPGETLRIDALLRDREGKLPTVMPPLFARLIQPDGRAVLERRLTATPLGLLSLELGSAADWPTGRWRVELRTDPSTEAPLAALPVHLEEFLPERLALELALSPHRPEVGEPLRLTLDAAYLYGAPAAGERFEVRQRLSPSARPLADRSGWYFGDLAASWPSGDDLIEQGELDAAGRAELSIPPPRDLPAPSDLEVEVTVFESGGRALRRKASATLWPAAELIGVAPGFALGEGARAESRVSFAIQRFARDGRTLGGEVEVVLLRRREQWVWILLKDGGFEPRRSVEETEVGRQRLSLDPSQPANVEFPIDWGEYLLVARDTATGRETKLPFRAGWSGSDAELVPDRVKLSLDGTAARGGGRLALSVDPPYAGPALLMVEADRPLLRRRFEARSGTRLELELTPEMIREDVYVSVIVLRPMGRGGAGPARAIGILPLPVDRSAHAATVRLEAPSTLEPGGRASIAVEAPELAGQEAEVILYAVDEGALGITRYRIPALLGAIFARRMFGAELRDLYGRVVGQVEGTLARLRFGGDAAPAPAPPTPTRPRAEVEIPDLRIGPVRLDAKGRAELTFDAPAFDGRLRLNALVYGRERFGDAEAVTTVRGALVISPTAPRALAPGDRGQASVVLHNTLERELPVRLRFDGSTGLELRPEGLSLALAPGERRRVPLEISPRIARGIARLVIQAEAGEHRFERRVEIAVRGIAPTEHRSLAFELGPRRSRTLPLGLAEGLVPGSVAARLTAAAYPPFPLESARERLKTFPLGCAEQTIGRAYAALDGTGEAHSVLLERALARLAGMQLADGHFAMWPESAIPNPMVTPLVAELLLDAEEAGHAVSAGMLERALEAMRRDLLRGDPSFHHSLEPDRLRFLYHAHAAYVLARAGRGEHSALLSLYERRGEAPGPRALAYLAAALHLAGEERLTREALRAMRATRPHPGGLHADFASPLAERLSVALVIARHRIGDAASLLWEAYREWSARQRGGQDAWSSGLSTFELATMLRLGELGASDARPLALQLDGGEGALALQGKGPLRREIPAESLDGLTIRNEGEQLAYVLVELAGEPSAPPAPRSEGISIRRDYFRRDGTPFEGGELTEGEVVIGRIRLSVAQPVANLLVEDLLPAGLELEIPALGDHDPFPGLLIDGLAVGQRHHGVTPDREEFRDDRYFAAMPMSWAGSEVTLFYVMTAVTPGEYQVPAARAEDMYRPWVYGIDSPKPSHIRIVGP